MNSAVVPAEWPVDASRAHAPAAALTWLTFIPAMLGVIIVPARVGASISRSSWSKALCAHVLSLAIGASLIGSTFLMVWPGGGAFVGGMSVGEWLRLPGALVISGLYWAGGTGTGSRAILGGLAGVQLGCWGAAAIAMPFMAAGEPTGKLFWRAVKLLLWASVCLVPLGMLILAAMLAFERFELNQHMHEPHLIVPVVALWSIWAVSVVLRLGSRYAGPVEGPGWRPREPRCAECGYNLTGQSWAGRCPECGTPVLRSTPTYRSHPEWATVAGGPRRCRAFVSNAHAILTRRNWFESLAVHDGRAPAIRFLTWTLAVASLLLMLGFLTFGILERRAASPIVTMLNAGSAIISITSAAGILLFLAFSLVILRSAHVEKCGILPTCITVCYASVLFVPACLLLSVCLAVGSYSLDSGWIGRVPAAGDWAGIVRYYGFHILNAAPPIAAFTWAMFRLRRALKDVRFAVA